MNLSHALILVTCLVMLKRVSYFVYRAHCPRLSATSGVWCGSSVVLVW